MAVAAASRPGTSSLTGFGRTGEGGAAGRAAVVSRSPVRQVPSARDVGKQEPGCQIAVTYGPGWLAIPAPVRASSAPRPGGLKRCPPPTPEPEAAHFSLGAAVLFWGRQGACPKAPLSSPSFPHSELYDAEAKKASAPGRSS